MQKYVIMKEMLYNFYSPPSDLCFPLSDEYILMHTIPQVFICLAGIYIHKIKWQWTRKQSILIHFQNQCQGSKAHWKFKFCSGQLKCPKAKMYHHIGWIRHVYMDMCIIATRIRVVVDLTSSGWNQIL